ncbi:GNAT family N-acetyltransferase [Acaryochloris marina]|uniref:Acetyltransferase, putative n=1 Tax=Acaryochloris marina (strain MBIC 11017) TaxID=329726 RepID=A8ZKZ9_ACAM1|nr:GNAT family N-acetyltransferase [Acaryochloris marina]ABW31467.1 acetyltransferase, putative [Acaryochloris marina MBIC11017]
MSSHQMPVLRITKREELECICELEQGEMRMFVIPYSLQKHQVEFAKPDVIYKSIWWNEELIGFFILVLDPDGQSVEFRRIIVSKPEQGLGTIVVRSVDNICSSELGRSRVWLDVFESNERARHVYEKCGYQLFGETQHEGRNLFLYEKTVQQS